MSIQETKRTYIPEKYGDAIIPATKTQLEANGGKFATEREFDLNGGMYPTIEKSNLPEDIVVRK